MTETAEQQQRRLQKERQRREEERQRLQEARKESARRAATAKGVDGATFERQWQERTAKEANTERARERGQNRVTTKRRY